MTKWVFRCKLPCLSSTWCTPSKTIPMTAKKAASHPGAFQYGIQTREWTFSTVVLQARDDPDGYNPRGNVARWRLWGSRLYAGKVARTTAAVAAAVAVIAGGLVRLLACWCRLKTSLSHATTPWEEAAASAVATSTTWLEPPSGPSRRRGCRVHTLI